MPPLVLSNGFQLGDLLKGPIVATRIYYYYDLKGAPIESIDLTLTDYSRNLKISGTSGSEIDTLVEHIKKDVSKSYITFGGSLSRSNLAFLCMFVCLLITWQILTAKE